MLDLFLFIIILVLELIHFFERKNLVALITNEKETSIPKARQSFVVRNMNEKLKNALFPQDSAE